MSLTSSRPIPDADVIAIACDHAGYPLKQAILQVLDEGKITVADLGCHSAEESVDYPVFGRKVVDAIKAHPGRRGILICGTGLGMSIMANRFAGIRAVLCHDLYSAIMSRRHNDANLLIMGGRVIGPGLAQEIVRTWLATPFDGGRHQARLELLEKLAAEGQAP